MTTVNEARTIILDKDGNELPVPAGTDPHLEKRETKAPAAQIKAEVKAKAEKGGK